MAPARKTPAVASRTRSASFSSGQNPQSKERSKGGSVQYVATTQSNRKPPSSAAARLATTSWSAIWRRKMTINKTRQTVSEIIAKSQNLRSL